jgi:hypothetical protein
MHDIGRECSMHMDRRRIAYKILVQNLRLEKNFENNNQSYLKFYPKSKKPIKVVICHLPPNTPVEYMFDGLVSLGFDDISANR